jgi:hypothetical protein
MATPKSAKADWTYGQSELACAYMEINVFLGASIEPTASPLSHYPNRRLSRFCFSLLIQHQE